MACQTKDLGHTIVLNKEHKHTGENLGWKNNTATSKMHKLAKIYLTGSQKIVQSLTMDTAFP